MKFTSFYISYLTSLLLLLTQILRLIYLLVFISALPMTTAVSSERPFPSRISVNLLIVTSVLKFH